MPTKKQRATNPIFVLSAGRPLRVLPDLLETLSIHSGLIDKRATKVFLAEAQNAWSAVCDEIRAGEINPITWLQGLLIESVRAGIWFPSVFLLRLRQLQRREIVIEDCQRCFEQERAAGLPREFAEFEKITGQRFSIVPCVTREDYESLTDSTTDASRFVSDVCSAWQQAESAGLSKSDFRRFVEAKLGREGWKW